MSGIEIRLASLLNPVSQRSVVVAFDHGTEGAIVGGEDVGTMLEKLISSGADGILLTPGLSRQYLHSSARRAPTLLTGIDLPIFGSVPATDESLTTVRSLCTPLDAIRLGAAVCKMLLPLGLDDREVWADALECLALRANQCSELGIPLMIEPAFWGKNPGKNDQAIVDAARVAVELGAHVLKVPAPRDPQKLADIVAWSPVPVYVLGGDPQGSEALARQIVEWMDAGATGVVVGRNVWNRPNPVAAINALRAAVHENDSIKAAALFEEAGAPLGS